MKNANDLKKVTLQSPVGKLRWVNLTKADNFGKYSVELVLADTPATRLLIEKIKAICPQKGRVPVKQENGEYVLKLTEQVIKTRRDGTSYPTKPPSIYNKDAVLFDEKALSNLRIGNGTTARINFLAKEYTMQGGGVSLKPLEVQLITIVDFNGGTGFTSMASQSEEEELLDDVSLGFSSDDGPSDF